MLRAMIVVLVAGGLAQASLAQRASVGFYRVGSQYSPSYINDLSRDGSIAVGSGLDPGQDLARVPLTWSYSSGSRPHLLPAGHTTGTFKAVSGDGRVAFSESRNPFVGIAVARYGSNGLIDTFPGMPGWQETAIFGADLSGSTFVGRARLSNPNSYGTPIIWHDGQYRSLNGIPGYGGTGEAVAVSDDGLTVVGNGTGDLSTSAFRWSEVAGYQMLPVLAGEHTGLAIDADGTTGWIAGSSGSKPVRWSPDGSILNLDPDRMFSSATATDVSDDGRTVVGYGRVGGDELAFIWRADDGMHLLTDYLSDIGISVPADMTRGIASAISSDGLTLAGTALTAPGREGWVAVIPSPASCAALVFGLTWVTRRSRNSRSTSAA